MKADIERESEEEAVVRRLAMAVEEIAAISDFRNAYRKPLCCLAWRIKLLELMFHELSDGRGSISESATRALAELEKTLAAAKDLLWHGSVGSKIFVGSLTTLLTSEEETIFSPDFDGDSQLKITNHGDGVKDETPKLPNLVADEGDDGTSGLTDYQACSLLDICISDSVPSLPFDSNV